MSSGLAATVPCILKIQEKQSRGTSLQMEQGLGGGQDPLNTCTPGPGVQHAWPPFICGMNTPTGGLAHLRRLADYADRATGQGQYVMPLINSPQILLERRGG